MVNKQFSVGLMGVAWLCAAPAHLQAEESLPPALFRDLLKVGQTVGISSTTTSPSYSLTIFSDEQAQALDRENAESAELERKLDLVERRLAMEDRVKERAALLVERDELQTKIRRPTIVGSRRYGTIYKVAYIGQDYVALDGDGEQRYLPLRSIRTMYRRNELSRESRFARRGDRGFRGGSESDSKTTDVIRLRYIDAAEAAAVLKEVFAEQDCTIEHDAASNSLVVSATRTTMSQIADLVENLDVKFGK